MIAPMTPEAIQRRWMTMITECLSLQGLDFLEYRCRKMGYLTPTLEQCFARRRADLEAGRD